ncbi:YjfB family protein [Dendrosporobacter sp. 1207_IL3150]|uniref:YjfB family protein n=1 Tax=Dendrosporobacter sp. 1207_IL3150 TaxID=3084054 RepID=UPI002FDA49E7
MDIAALSIINSQTEVQNTASVLILKKAMETAETNNISLINDLLPPSPTLGAKVDIKV